MDEAVQAIQDRIRDAINEHTLAHGMSEHDACQFADDVLLPLYEEFNGRLVEIEDESCDD